MSQTSVQTAHRDSQDEPETQASEATPLLGDGEHAADNDPERDAERNEEASTPPGRFSFTMTWLRLNLLSLTLSIIAFILSIGYLIYSEVSGVRSSWTASECMPGIAVTVSVTTLFSALLRSHLNLVVMIATFSNMYLIDFQAVVTLVVSLVNLRSIQRDGRQIPRVLNIIIDGLICFYILSFGIVFLSSMDNSQCRSWSRRNCRELEIIGQVIGGSAAGIAIALG